eukprot:SAG11_NODE_35772_length_265_cov_0.614458_1_plen_64_part_01
MHNELENSGKDDDDGSWAAGRIKELKALRSEGDHVLWDAVRAASAGTVETLQLSYILSAATRRL